MLILVVSLLVVAAAIVVVPSVLEWRGKRLVRCPETGATAAVDVDVKRALVSEVFGRGDLMLSDCSRWPDRAGCGQECLHQIALAPEGCRVRTIASKWYAGKACAYCGRRFGEIRWHDHRPALRTGRGVTRQWSDVRPEELPELFATCRPVCWDCHEAESFRREFAQLVVDREAHTPPRAGRSSGG